MRTYENMLYRRNNVLTVITQAKEENRQLTEAEKDFIYGPEIDINSIPDEEESEEK